MSRDFSTTSEQYQTVIHHQAVALEYLLTKVVIHAGGSPEQWRQEAFEYALRQWQEQAPRELEALLERSVKALQQAVSVVNSQQGGQS